jgi:hypothetical protein
MSLLDVLTAAKPPFGVPPFAPAPLETGSSQFPTTADNLPAKRGLSGFLDRFMNPQNALGQFGRALVMAGGTPLGTAYQLMDQQRRTQGQTALENQLKLAELAHTQAETAHLGAGPEPDEFTRTLIAAGIDPHGPEGIAAYKSRATNMYDPVLPQVVHDEDPVTHTITDRVIGVPTSAIRGGQLPAPAGGVASPAPAASPAPLAPASARGIRNNNPLNLTLSGWTKQQEGFSGTDPGGRYARFDTPEHGMQGGVALLQNYLRRGITTPAAIIEKWAPSKENGASTQNYVNYVAQRLGIAPGDPVTPDKLPTLVRAMYEFENGQRAGGAPPNTDRAALIAQASDAIAKGADPVKVHARLREMGVE